MKLERAGWNYKGIVSFYENHRRTTDDLYPSEWFFLKDLLRERMSVLDIGCALGGFASILSEHLRDFKYTGLDISSEMVQCASQKHPQHSFHHIPEADLSILKGETFDLTLCFGILHLSYKWRELIVAAWKHTAGHFLFDLRETHLRTTEDPKRSYLRLSSEEECGAGREERLPYNIINAAEALDTIIALCPDAKKICHYGYLHPVSEMAVCPQDQVMMNTYLIAKSE